MEITIYHKPNCSTSLAAYYLLKKKKVKPKVIEYLLTPPTETELKELLIKLDMKAEQLVRKKEKIYKENFSDRAYSEKEWLKILIEHPILIERPIIVKGDKAIIARPPERVLDFIKAL